MEYAKQERNAFLEKRDYQLEFTSELCCECGTLIEPNSANMCVFCIRKLTDISEGIKKNLSIYYCKFCQRFLNPPDTWVKYELESRELLTMCLKRLNNFNEIRLVDAKFIWTEPHSYSLVIQITIQKEVVGVILEETMNIDVKIFKQMCTDCHKIEANDFYRAIVQTKSKPSYASKCTKTGHKKTLFYLEQVILKQKAADDCCKIKVEKDGIDFFFKTPQQAHKFIDLVACFVPCTHKESQELISHDPKNNIFNYKYTTLVTIPPICKDDVVCLNKRYAKSLGLANTILVCFRVTTLMHLIDPLTHQVTAKDYFNNPFETICTSSRLSKYMIIDVDLQNHNHGVCPDTKEPFSIADVTLIQSNMESDGIFIVKSHLGNALKPGNYERRNYRRWKLRRIKQANKTASTSLAEEIRSDKIREYEEFLNDVEEDAETRKNVEIYISEEDRMSHESMLIRGEQMIGLNELMNDLDIKR
ncbi:LOW QUALITY PROTEIN: hypothetical protein MXB_919 [Myxobolus squamalis]|nr:LOW QUALITY PROTEIN: hypothetical protein MXB_919 [Myxobolus squamalis]